MQTVAPLAPAGPGKSVHAGEWVILTIACFAASFYAFRESLHAGIWSDDLSYAQLIRPGDGWIKLVRFLDPAQQGGWPYRPVFLIYFGALRLLFGDRFFYFHAAGVTLHAAVLVLFAALVWRLTAHKGLSLAAAALLFLYPGKEEAVAWVSAMSTVLAALFSLLTLHCWLSWKRSGGRYWFGSTAVCFALALGSKQDALSLPLVLIALDALLCRPPGPGPRRLQNRLRAAFRQMPRFWIPILLLILWANKANLDAGGYALNMGVGRAVVSAEERVHNVLFFFHQATLGLFFSLHDALTILVLLLLTGIAIRSRPLLFSWLWLLAALLPNPLGAGIHVVSGGRFLYMPAMPFSMFVTLLGWSLIRTARVQDRMLLIVLIAGLLERLGTAWIRIPERLYAEPFVWLMVLLIVAGWVWLMHRDGRIRWPVALLSLDIALFLLIRSLTGAGELWFTLAAVLILLPSYRAQGALIGMLSLHSPFIALLGMLWLLAGNDQADARVDQQGSD